MELKKHVTPPPSKIQMFSSIVDITDKVIPIFTEKQNREWIPYGDDNKFPEELITLYNKSGIHNAIIKSKLNMICGDGFIQDPEMEYSERTEQFINRPNPEESMYDILRKVALDFEIMGLSYIEVIWSKDRLSIPQIYHIDASKIRWGKLNDKNRLDKFYYSRDWDNYRKERFKPIEVPIFSDIKRGKRQILPIYSYIPNQDYYSLPDYIGALKWIQIDCEIANFHFNNLKNGMSPSIFFGFPVGQTTEQERQMIEDKIIDKYQGTTQSGKFLLAFYDAEGENKPEVKIMEMTNADKQYDLLNKTTLQQILIGHKVVNENLVGISTPGKLGSANEVLENYELYYNTVIKNQQKSILDAFNKVLLINGMNPVDILENTPISINFSENILQNILERDEMREIVGYEPLNEAENEIIDETLSGFTIKNRNGEEKYEYLFAGLRKIDKNTPDQDIIDAHKTNPNEMYVWRVENKKNPCPSCEGYKNQVRTLHSWMRTAIPGKASASLFTTYPHSPFGTFCEDACQCRLVKVGRASKK